jgi:hypothetical protein
MSVRNKFDPTTIGYWSHALPIGTIVRHYHTQEIAEVFGYRKRNGVILIDVIEPGTHVGKWDADASWLPICTKQADGKGEPTAFDLLFDPVQSDDFDVTTYEDPADCDEDAPDYFAKDAGTGWSLADEERYYADELRSAEDKARDEYGLTDGEQEYLDSRGER